ncbi:cysteine dioxygenase family protein [Pseudonocardia sp. TRM90224]|uniref:cysteine dioxygenase family protein n=1 Tax=Pseudonocardia sp. TRM90224 TaxID=2812678 RepID=UPI001E59BC4E|nr:cysteine dioxygenase family protein [Pseudonocardia sp. TRM90224]
MTSTTLTRPGLAPLLSAIADTLHGADREDGAATAALVARAVRAHRPTAALLTAHERRGTPDKAVGFLLHAEPSFSVQAVVWRPGQESSIHDHRTWCVVGVLQGTEIETRYADHGDHVTVVGQWRNPPGEAHGFAPPGDIHKVASGGPDTLITLHVYGADLSDGSSSLLRRYDVPVR